MAYQSLYRKYRPQTFADVVGQGHVVRTLQNAITSGRIAHGYLFTGTRGTAKTTIARLLAKALNCQGGSGPVAEPCNACNACLSITAGGSVDVIEMDAASHRGVADIEEVRKNVGYGPMDLRFKVFIIDEAHQLSSDAKDAFLKTLEEPPPGVVFILATTEPQSIPITIRSRCQQFDFKRGSLLEISGRIKYVLETEGVSYTDEAVALVARGAEGSYRDSLSLLEQVLAFSPEKIDAESVQTVLGTLDRETLALVVDIVARRDAPGAFALAGQILNAGKEARTLIKTLSSHFRDLLLVRVGGPAVMSELTPDDVKSLQPQAARFDPAQLLKAIEVLNEAFSETRWNNQHRLLTELTFLKLMNLGEGVSAPLSTAPIVFTTVSPSPNNGEPASVPPPVSPPTPPAYSSQHPAAGYPGEGVSTKHNAVDQLQSPPLLGAGGQTLAEGERKRGTSAREDAEPAPLAVETLPIIGAGGNTDEPIDSSYFAGEGESEDDGIELEGPSSFDEIDDLPPIPLETEPENEGRALFAEIEAPAPEPEPIAGALSGGDEPAPKVPLPESPLPPPGGGESGAEERGEALRGTDSDTVPYTLDDVQRAWPRFLMQAKEVSQKASVQMASAQPSAVVGKMIIFTFSSPSSFEMMNQPKQLEFVRKLLAMVLDCGESVPIRFELSAEEATISMKFERPAEKPKLRHDPIAKLQALRDGQPTSAPPAPGSPSSYDAPPRPAPRVAERPATYPPSLAGGGGEPASRGRQEAQSAPNPWSVRHDEPSRGPKEDPQVTARREVALAEPLVQDALEVFGGEIVVD